MADITSLPIGPIISGALSVICFVMERIEKLTVCNKMQKRVLDTLDSLQVTMKKIERNIKDDDDRRELISCVSLLNKIKDKCDEHGDQGQIKKFAKAPCNYINLHSVETELKLTLQRLNLFAQAMIIEVSRNTEMVVQDETRLRKIFEKSSRTGVTCIVDSCIKVPKSPLNLTVTEDKDNFILSWHRTERGIIQYEVMYDTSKRLLKEVDGAQFENKSLCTITLPWPLVEPGNLYTMKVRAINGGGPGEWSEEIVAQFKKPLPQKPEISKLVMWSTMAKITTKVAEKICSTQSPTVCWEIGYACDTDGKWLTLTHNKNETGEDFHHFLVDGLLPKRKYFFRMKAKNKEGWSVPSETISDYTKPLPDKPLKPCIPNITFHTPTKASITVRAPENIATIEVPILQWEICYCLDKWNRIQYKTDLTEESSTISLPDIQRSTIYRFAVRVLNEAGWSAYSDVIHSGRPCKPETLRTSGKRTHSLIKIRWSAPAEQSAIITHYEVNKGDKTQIFEDKCHLIPSKYSSATFIDLKQNTYYTFRVRCVNDTLKSDWSEVLLTNTRIHKAIKGAFSPVVWALGTIAAPLVGPVSGGIAGGVVGKQASGNAAAVAGGVAGTAAGVVAGTVGAPLIGAAYAHAFVHGMDGLSDQSDDESDPESVVKYIHT